MSEITVEQPSGAIDDVIDERRRGKQLLRTAKLVLELLDQEGIQWAIHYLNDVDNFYPRIQEGQPNPRALFERGLGVLESLDPSILRVLRDTGVLDSNVMDEFNRRESEKQAEDEFTKRRTAKFAATHEAERPSPPPDGLDGYRPF